MDAIRPVPVRLYLLQLAIGEDGTPIPGYLIQTSDGKNILIDTGLFRDNTVEAPGNGTMHIDYVVDQLATLGLTPRDVDMLICTHFDPDHSGNHDDFPWSELIVQHAHYEAARSGDFERFNRTRAHWNHPSLRYRLVDGDTELVPGVELIETSGHVPGHQAVLVRLPETGPMLLAIDAVALAEDFDPETRPDVPDVDMDVSAARASTRKLVELARREGVTLTVFGHDEKLWPALKKAPDFYA